MLIKILCGLLLLSIGIQMLNVAYKNNDLIGKIGANIILVIIIGFIAANFIS